MAENRTFNIIWRRPDRPRVFDLEARPDATVQYDGRQQSVVLRR
jgi:hypothetical protein